MLNAQGSQIHFRNEIYQYFILGIFPLMQASLWSREYCDIPGLEMNFSILDGQKLKSVRYSRLNITNCSGSQVIPG